MRFLPKLLNKAIHKGSIELTGPEGEKHLIGGRSEGPSVSLRITDPKLDWKIAFNPELVSGEAYMNGTLIIEDGEIYDLLELFFLNKRHLDLTANQIVWKSIARKIRRFKQHNPIKRSLANVQHHYDIGNDLYRLFLDKDMQYSCGYYPGGDESLDEAQLAKKRHLAAKLQIQDGQTILDIGCGWGGLAIYLSQIADVKVVGVTLSSEQIDVARKRAKAAGVEDRVSFELIDYRDVSGTFDRIVSVGMLEHVGAHFLKQYFMKVRDLLSADGLALVHSISSKAPPGITGPFLAKYIFPGGYSPSLSETIAAVEQVGLWSLDVEIWRKHYGQTLRQWRERCKDKKQEIIALYDEPFYRMWEFYLAACEGAFFHGAANVFQLQLARDKEAAPLSRDYILEETKAIKLREESFLPRIEDSAQKVFDEA